MELKAKIVAEASREEGYSPKCWNVLVTNRPKGWGVVQSSSFAWQHQSSCQPGEGYVIIKLTPSGWVRLNIGGSQISCDELSRRLSKAGAPSGVFGQLGAFCSSGLN
jgi:hypothetical protein